MGDSKTKVSSVRCIHKTCKMRLLPDMSCFGLELNFKLWIKLTVTAQQRTGREKTSHTDTFGGQMTVRWAGRARLLAQGGVFKHDLTGKLFGTGQNRSFKRGVRPTRVFVKRGSTVVDLGNQPPDAWWCHLMHNNRWVLGQKCPTDLWKTVYVSNKM